MTLAAPHGGQLVNLIVPQSEQDQLKAFASSLPSWDLNGRQLCDIEMLLNGGFSPLTGFLGEADFESVRGPFKFNSNNHPIQNWYGREVVEMDGEYRNKITGVIAENHADAYVGECQM